MKTILFCLVFLPLGLSAQTIKTTEFTNSSSDPDSQCLTPSPNYEEALRYREKLQPFIEQRNESSSASKIVVRLVVHRVRSIGGNEGPTDAVIEAAIDKARLEFAGGDICFSLDGINNVYYQWLQNVNNNNVQNITGNPLNLTYGDPDRLDVYIYPTASNIAGVAGGIPSDYFAIGEQRLLNWITFSHEIGHCLGLYHTHQGFNADCSSGNNENIDGSNCTTAGDLICDTPADPLSDPWNTNNIDTLTCTFVANTLTDCNGDSPYDPLLNNIMSYAGICRSVFTTDQFDVMRAELLSGTTGPLIGEILPLTLGINSGTVTNGEYHRSAFETITTAVNANITISNNAKVYHNAGQKIILGVGFEAKPTNGRYTGRIGDPCN